MTNWKKYSDGLFCFDVKCAFGSKAICEYGYVLTGDKLIDLRKINILIDPECEFNQTGREQQDGSSI